MTLKEKFWEIIKKPQTDRPTELEIIADDYACEVLEWSSKNAYNRGENSYLLWDNDKEPLTSKQLLEIFKKENGY